MPQVMCPNCGMTINLKNRKKIDVQLIKSAVKSGPKTFTELLSATKLSRKTLSLRLKELCASNVLIKNDGAYELTSVLDFTGKSTFMSKILLAPTNRKIRTGIMLLVLLLSSTVSGYVLAMFFSSPAPNHEIIGTFTMDLNVNNVTDLYSWQVVIIYNSTMLKVLTTVPGGFVGEEFPLFVNSTDSFEDLLLIAGLLIGNVPGKNGSGRLATIVFGYYSENYDEPKIVPRCKVCETLLLDSQGQPIPVADDTLTLVKKP